MCLHSAEEIRQAFQTKHLLARIRPARLFYRTASEALRTIKVSCLIGRQVDHGTDLCLARACLFLRLDLSTDQIIHDGCRIAQRQRSEVRGPRKE